MKRIVACVLVALAALVKRHSPTLAELLHGSTRSSDPSTANVEAFDEMEVAGLILRDGAFGCSGLAVAGSRLAAAGAHELETSAIEVHHCVRPPELWPGKGAAKPACQSFAGLRFCGLGGLLAFDHAAALYEPDTGPECAAVDERASTTERAAIAERAGANWQAAVADAERAVRGRAAVAQRASVAERAATAERSLIVGRAVNAAERATDVERAGATTMSAAIASADAAGRAATGHERVAATRERVADDDPEEIVGAGVAEGTILLGLLVYVFGPFAAAVAAEKTAEERAAELGRAATIAKLERAATIAEIERERATAVAERAIWAEDRESAASPVT